MKKLNKTKIFIICSTVFLGSLIILYGYRFIHYYRYYNKKEEVNTTVSEPITIYKHILSYLGTEEDIANNKPTNLYKNSDGTYYFKGQVQNNYIFYSGLLWRIVKINDDNSVMLITEETQTELPYGDTLDFEKSYVNNYINNVDSNSIFYNNLINTDYLTNTKYCTDNIDDFDNTSCTNTNNNYKLTLLTTHDYINSGANNGYLNNETYFWLMNSNSNKKLYYVFNEGGVNSTNKYDKTHYGIRPVISIKGDIVLNGGDGTKENPFFIDEYENYKLANVGVGEYLEYSGNIWRIINKTEDAVKVAMEGYLKVSNEEIEKEFSTKDNTYRTDKDTSIGYYLNNTFYNTLDNKEYLVKGPFYTGKYSTDSYDYRLVFKTNVKAYVGLPQIGDLYINKYDNSLTMLGITDHMNNIIYVIKDNLLYTSKISAKAKIRPVLYLNGNLITLNGEGTLESPYIIGR